MAKACKICRKQLLCIYVSYSVKHERAISRSINKVTFIFIAKINNFLEMFTEFFSKETPST